jgi:hypothetical protein
MRTTLLSAAAAFALLAFSGGAQAQCWWNGWTTTCAAPPVYAQPYYGSYNGSPYAAFNAYDYRDYRNQPDWLPTYPGPRPGR